MPDVSSAKGAAEDMLRLMDSKPQIDGDGEGREILSKGEKSIKGTAIASKSGHVEIRNIQFEYRMAISLSSWMIRNSLTNISCASNGSDSSWSACAP